MCAAAQRPHPPFGHLPHRGRLRISLADLFPENQKSRCGRNRSGFNNRNQWKIAPSHAKILKKSSMALGSKKVTILPMKSVRANNITGSSCNSLICPVRSYLNYITPSKIVNNCQNITILRWKIIPFIQKFPYFSVDKVGNGLEHSRKPNDVGEAISFPQKSDAA